MENYKEKSHHNILMIGLLDTLLSDDTAAATPAEESTLDIAETDGAAEEPDLEIATAKQIECLPLSQPTIPYQYPPS